MPRPRWSLLLPCLTAALPALAALPRPTVLQLHDWYPGHLPGRHDRRTVTLTLDGGVATLEARTERPPGEERRRFNVSAWRPVEEPPRRLEGTVKWGASVTLIIPTDAEMRAAGCTPEGGSHAADGCMLRASQAVVNPLLVERLGAR